jgi:hypothetical protein
MSLQRPLQTNMARQIFGRSDTHVLALLRAAWWQAVGTELGRRTEVVALEGRTLRIRVPDAGWRKVLHRMRGDLLGRLRAIAGSLAPYQLGFVEGKVPGAGPAPPGPSSPPALPPPDAAPDVLVADAAVIPDPELRARFLETARRYLHRTRPSSS